MKRLLLGIAALVLSGGLAVAQTPEKVAEHYFEKGNTAYNLGRWDEAIENFTKAYEAWSQPEFLYNIAQSYRQAGNCKQALYFYKRFRSLKDEDKQSPLTKQKREEIEKFIKQLSDCVAKADSTAGTKPDGLDRPPGAPPDAKTTTPSTTSTTTTTPTPTTTTSTTTRPPSTTTPPATTTTTTTAAKTTPTTTTSSTTTPPPPTPVPGSVPPKSTAALEKPDGDGEEQDTDTTSATKTTEAEGPTMVSARIVTGVALLSAGDLNMPAQPSFGIVGGYPLHVGPALLELGAGLSYSPLPYEVMGAQKRGTLLGVRAVAGAVYPVAPKLALRGELGLGIASLSGLEMGNPLVEDQTAKSFTLLNVRFAVAAEYLITPNIAAMVSPFGIAFSPGGDGMYGSSLREIDLLVGVGYRR